MNWDVISKEQNLSEEFIKEYKEDLNWDIFSASQHMSYLFIHEYIDSLNIEQMKQNLHLSYLSEEKWNRIERMYTSRLESYITFSRQTTLKTPDTVDLSVDITFHSFFHSFLGLQKEKDIRTWEINLHIQEHEFFDFQMSGFSHKEDEYYTYRLPNVPCTKKEMHILKQSISHFLRKNDCNIISPFL